VPEARDSATKSPDLRAVFRSAAIIEHRPWPSLTARGTPGWRTPGWTSRACSRRARRVYAPVPSSPPPRRPLPLRRAARLVQPRHLRRSLAVPSSPPPSHQCSRRRRHAAMPSSQPPANTCQPLAARHQPPATSHRPPATYTLPRRHSGLLVGDVRCRAGHAQGGRPGSPAGRIVTGTYFGPSKHYGCPPTMGTWARLQ
jgi:hypothetical protein